MSVPALCHQDKVVEFRQELVDRGRLGSEQHLANIEQMMELLRDEQTRISTRCTEIMAFLVSAARSLPQSIGDSPDGQAGRQAGRRVGLLRGLSRGWLAAS